MKEKEPINFAAIIGACVVCASIFIGWGLANFKSGVEHSISATGSASVNFESDLIVWRGSFSAHAETAEQAYRRLQSDAEAVRKFLLENDISENEFTFSSVNIERVKKDIYDDNGNYRGVEDAGYDLTQTLAVSSHDLDAVEKVSTDISSLLSSGIQFTSGSPEYYCTTIDEVKLDLIEKATENARMRVGIIVANSGARCGRLINSNLGVFQITAMNSGSGAYSYDGCLDTTSRNKTATITVKLTYKLK